MDGILQDLGVEFVDESESERLVMGSKIEASLRYSLGIDVLTMPEIPNVPQLSPKYMQKIIDEVKSEIEKCDIGSKSRLLATLKLQFLSSLVFRQVNANTADSTNNVRNLGSAFNNYGYENNNKNDDSSNDKEDEDEDDTWNESDNFDFNLIMEPKNKRNEERRMSSTAKFDMKTDPSRFAGIGIGGNNRLKDSRKEAAEHERKLRNLGISSSTYCEQLSRSTFTGNEHLKLKRKELMNAMDQQLEKLKDEIGEDSTLLPGYDSNEDIDEDVDEDKDQAPDLSTGVIQETSARTRAKGESNQVNIRSIDIGDDTNVVSRRYVASSSSSSASAFASSLSSSSGRKPRSESSLQIGSVNLPQNRRKDKRNDNCYVSESRNILKTKQRKTTNHNNINSESSLSVSIPATIPIRTRNASKVSPSAAVLQNINSNSDSNSNENDDTFWLECPLCQRKVGLEFQGQDPDMAMARHVDRCSRRRNVAIDYRHLEEALDDVEAPLLKFTQSDISEPNIQSEAKMDTHDVTIDFNTNDETKAQMSIQNENGQVRENDQYLLQGDGQNGDAEEDAFSEKELQEMLLDTESESESEDENDGNILNDEQNSRDRHHQHRHKQDINHRNTHEFRSIGTRRRMLLRRNSNSNSRRRDTTSASISSNPNTMENGSPLDDSEIEECVEDSDLHQAREVSNGLRGLKAKAVPDWDDEVYMTRITKLRETHEEALLEFYAQHQAHVPRTTWNTLHEYQQEGAKWLWQTFVEHRGGILGDEMGLGKTAQICTHLHSIAAKHWNDRDTTRRIQDEGNQVNNDGSVRNRNGRQPQQRVHGQSTSGSNRTTSARMPMLVVCPATVLKHWIRELHRWAPRLRAVICHSISSTFNELNSLGKKGLWAGLEALLKKPDTYGLVCVTTYETLRAHRSSLLTIRWAAVVLDEGHRIRNPDAEVSIVSKLLSAHHRLILSGTPIQNSLRELWSLFDFVAPGRLGSLHVFEQEIADPIRLGGYSNASYLQKEVAIQTATMLQDALRPFLLRRRKQDVRDVVQLPNKTEQVLFCRLTDRQRSLYRDIIRSPEVQAVLEGRMKAFRAITTLRKLCNHPALVYAKGRMIWSDEMEDEVDDNINNHSNNSSQKTSKVNKGSIAWDDSGKLAVIKRLLPLWKADGSKVLLFTQTQSMLNILEAMLRHMDMTFVRIDGSTPINKRDRLINEYNTDPKIFAAILTTRTGGVGISLTAANRLLLVDPDWNPQTDIQARERAWRIGQMRDVTVYRLITRGTIEEKIYHRQIFKLLLSDRILDNSQQKGLFTQNDLHELFQLEDDRPVHNDDTGGNDKERESNQQSTLESSDDDDFDSGNSRRRGRRPAPTHRRVSGSNRSGTTSAMSTTIDLCDDESEVEEVTETNTEVGLAKAVGAIDVERAQRLCRAAQAASQSRNTTTNGGDSSSNGDETRGRDNRLLSALINGDAIAGVYDHDKMDPLSVNRSKSRGRGSTAIANARTAQSARRIADRAMQEIQRSAVSTSSSSSFLSSSSTISSSIPSSRNAQRFGTEENAATGNGGRVSSSSLLARFKRNKEARSTSSNNNSSNRVRSTSPADGGDEAHTDVLRRLQNMFSPNDPKATQGRTTQRVLNQFSDLDDRYASIFRELLLRVANFHDGKWYPLRQPSF